MIIAAAEVEGNFLDAVGVYGDSAGRDGVAADNHIIIAGTGVEIELVTLDGGLLAAVDVDGGEGAGGQRGSQPSGVIAELGIDDEGFDVGGEQAEAAAEADPSAHEAGVDGELVVEDGAVVIEGIGSRAAGGLET